MRHQDIERLHIESPGDDLTERVPGQALMSACLRIQDAAPERTRPARLFGVHALHPDARSWFAGVQGERTTARLLDSLGPEVVVLHSVPVSASGTDIDHVVVGPMGVVTITTKHLRDAKVSVDGDTVTVSGRREPFVPAARIERRRVQHTLAALTLPVTPVTPVVAVVDAARIDVRRGPDDVLVVDARRLGRRIRRMPHVLGHDAVWALAGALASATTWSVAHEPDDPDVRDRFRDLEHRVAIARVVRLGWASLACAAVAAGTVAVAAAVPALLL